MSKIILQGIVYDDKSSYLRGPAKAPPLIRQAYRSNSANFFAESGVEITPDVFDDKGDFEIVEYFDIESITSSNLNKNTPLITLGGDHSISYPVLRAIHKVYGPVDILHLDAHGDLYDSFEGDKYSHACPFARIMEEGLAGELHQVGIRTLNSHQRKQAKKYGVKVVEMKDYHLNKIPEFKRPVYLSLDMDVLDPAFAPGVSHYEPGGLTTRELISIIHRINVPVLGADLVEYNPERDINNMTAMVCAKILKEIAAKCLQ
ncbi:agmatinase [Muriicola sp. Z0-33]|uniref:agmatinase n=1 Tax=Muriicola sp. Z0-33 TaxID=2816957 RepID=UPI0022388C6E|nr:agmatinase [Muriicola sp. Z0-33]MCW5516678.1 agmatinase [Muriicola sp. Z0-33]